MSEDDWGEPIESTTFPNWYASSFRDHVLHTAECIGADPDDWIAQLQVVPWHLREVMLGVMVERECQSLPPLAELNEPHQSKQSKEQRAPRNRPMTYGQRCAKWDKERRGRR